jgi:16S rRNA G527 N7-methylase RsmG
MTDYTNTYPDLVNVEDWLNAKGYTGEAGACHQAMSLIRKQEKRIADLRKEADMMHSEYKTARARIAELEAEKQKDVDAIKRAVNRIEELTAALKPFADKATVYPKLPDNWLAHVTMKQLRAARVALGEKE